MNSVTNTITIDVDNLPPYEESTKAKKYPAKRGRKPKAQKEMEEAMKKAEAESMQAALRGEQGIATGRKAFEIAKKGVEAIAADVMQRKSLSEEEIARLEGQQEMAMNSLDLAYSLTEACKNDKKFDVTQAEKAKILIDEKSIESDVSVGDLMLINAANAAVKNKTKKKEEEEKMEKTVEEVKPVPVKEEALEPERINLSEAAKECEAAANARKEDAEAASRLLKPLREKILKLQYRIETLKITADYLTGVIEENTNE